MNALRIRWLKWRLKHLTLGVRASQQQYSCGHYLQQALSSRQARLTEKARGVADKLRVLDPAFPKNFSI